jgi:membrane protein
MSEPVRRKTGFRLKASLTAAPLVALAALAALWPWRRSLRKGEKGPAPCLTPEQFDAAEPGRGRAATAPWRIPAKGWKDILWRTWREIGRGHLPALAAAVTFYLLLATFPAIAAFVSLYGIFTDVDTVERQLALMADFLPRDALHVIGAEMLRVTQTRNSTLGATFAVTTLISVWSANAGMKALFDGVNVAYDETEKRPWLRLTLFTYATTLAGLTLLTILTAVAISAPMFAHGLGVRHARQWLTPVRWLTVYLAAAGVFSLTYRFGPSRTPALWRWVAPGGAAAAALWMGGSLVYTWGLDRFTHFGVTYGSLGAILGLMLWLWFSSMTVLIGAELNAEIEHQTAWDTTVGEARPLGQRGAAMADSVGRAFAVSLRDVAAMVGERLRELGAAVRRLARL